MTTIAVIGVGHMGSAIIKGLKNNPENPVNPRVSKLAEKLDFKLVNTLSDLIAKEPEIVVLTTPANITLDLIPE